MYHAASEFRQSPLLLRFCPNSREVQAPICSKKICSCNRLAIWPQFSQSANLHFSSRLSSCKSHTLQSEAGENSVIVNSSQEAPNKTSEPQSETGNDDTTTPEKKKRKTSKVWNEFTVVVMKDGTKKNQCNYCRARLAYQNTGSTTHLNRHMLTCGVRLATISGKTQQVLALPTMEPDGRIGNLTSFRYDKEKVRDILAKMIIVHEYPFRMVEHAFFQLLMKTLNPKFESMSRVTVRSDCMKIYALEKKKIKALLGSVDRISLTSDLWTSNQTIGYMCLTAHFLDNDWNLQKRSRLYLGLARDGLLPSSFNCCLLDTSPRTDAVADWQQAAYSSIDLDGLLPSSFNCCLLDTSPRTDAVADWQQAAYSSIDL
ncbi:zinc finger BED domain-containing protein RICESLEEPER 2-like [Canna indica]|uniref:Zinc finger BED domain-containing protein RICESLEEPER 2-like n=1 Tax=Canna indica TaxID=4628 RepID=A0AAQ3K2B8_9LILI|nr:zinc finger BED domain-containing protein RICESLEEPER 2-like [Canna indica]